MRYIPASSVVALRACFRRGIPTDSSTPSSLTVRAHRAGHPCAPALSQVALFIFHGASRDKQAGVAKPSPAAAKLTALVKRMAPKLIAGERVQRVKPTAVAPDKAARVTATTHDGLVLQSCGTGDFSDVDLDSDDEGVAVHPEPPIGIATAHAPH